MPRYNFPFHTNPLFQKIISLLGMSSDKCDQSINLLVYWSTKPACHGLQMSQFLSILPSPSGSFKWQKNCAVLIVKSAEMASKGGGSGSLIKEHSPVNSISCKDSHFFLLQSYSCCFLSNNVLIRQLCQAKMLSKYESSSNSLYRKAYSVIDLSLTLFLEPYAPI